MIANEFRKKKKRKSVKSSVKLLYQDKTFADSNSGKHRSLLYYAESCLEKVLRKRVTYLYIFKGHL